MIYFPIAIFTKKTGKPVIANYIYKHKHRTTKQKPYLQHFHPILNTDQSKSFHDNYFDLWSLQKWVEKVQAMVDNGASTVIIIQRII